MQQLRLYDWLIVVFLHEVQEYMEQSNAMKKAIEDAGCGDNIMVIMIRDSISKDPDTPLPSFRLTVSRLEKMGTSNTWCFIPDDSPLLKINNPDRHCWETAFKYIYSNYFGERNMLITYSEGAGYGINAEQGRIVRPQVPAPMGAVELAVGKTTLAYNKYYYLDETEAAKIKKDHGFVAAALVEHTNGWAIEKASTKNLCRNLEVLWISELAIVLQRYLRGNKIDVFLMANCYMQLFDNGYTLAGVVKYLVASEGYMPSTGFNFPALMTTLNDCPCIHSKTLVEQIVNDVGKMYADANNSVELNKATLYANRLKFYPIALKIFEQLITQLERILPQIIGKLAAIRAQMKSVTDNDNLPLVDAGLWIGLVTTQISEIEGATYFRYIFTTIQKKIVTHNLLGALVDDSGDDIYPKFGYSGISLYYPETAEGIEAQSIDWCANFDSSIPSPFRTDSKWSKFLTSYFAELAKTEKPA